MSFFKSTILAALAVSGILAAPAGIQSRCSGVCPDISVELTGPGVAPWTATGFAEHNSFSISSPGNQGPFSHAKVIFSSAIKQKSPGIENRYRCALKDAQGKRIVTTRGESVDFTFGNDGNPNAWALKNGPFSNVQVTCGPQFKRFNDDKNLIRVRLMGDDYLRQQLEFSRDEVTGRTASRTVGGARFRSIQLFLGPNVNNQDLRCQATRADGTIIGVDRSAQINQPTFSDGDGGAWIFHVGGDGRAAVSTVTCGV